MSIIKAIIITLVVVCSTTAFSQSFSFKTYEEEDGLRHAYIYAISQSSQGYLYLSAGEALYRFDGRRFKEYSNVTLKESFVATHFIDSHDLVWIGHNQRGITLLRDEELFPISHSSLGSSKVTGFVEFKNRIYVASNGAGLFVVDSTYNLQPVKAGGLQQVMTICAANSRILVGTPEGLRICERVSEKDFSIRATVEALEGLSIKQIIPSQHLNTYWVLTEYDGLFRVRINIDKVESVEKWQSELGTENPGLAIYEDHERRIWLSVPGEGVRQLTPKKEGKKTTLQVLLFHAANGLQSQQVQSFFQDNEGNMWFGTFGDGLIQKTQQKFSFFGVAEGMPHANISKALPGDNNKVWIGTAEGLYLYNIQDNSSEKIASGVGAVNDIIIDAEERVWFATDNGLYCKSGDEIIDCFKKLDQPPRKIRGLTLLGNLIIGGTSEGVVELRRDLSQISWFRTNEGLLHNNINHIFADSQRRIWISSHGTPLYYIKDGKFTVFKDLSGHPSFNHNAVYEDAEKNIWVATEGDGVFKYDGKTFVNYNHEQGLLSDYAIGLAQDGAGSIWVSHRGGLSEKTRSANYFSAVTKRSGLLFFENNPNAISRGKLGNIWAGTSKGMVRYRIGERNTREFKPHVFINEVYFNDVKEKLTTHIEKSYSNYAIRIDFLAISINHQQDIFYKYRLFGVDSTWKTTTMSYLEIPRLADGEYRFEVIACINRSGICSEKPASVSFTIEKPIWKNFLFYLVIVFSVVFITFVIIRVRTRRLRGMQHLLQLKVRQKTFLLQREKEAVEKIKGELEKRNKDITDSINYAKNIQDSILPPDELLQELFGEKYFVLFRPKDIVSGDIYWAAPLNVNNNNKKELALAAVIDCTGHGVPGAFLSIMANDFLKQSIVSRNVNNTNEILNFLNEEVSSHLNQSQTKRVQDGMDISLIGLDIKKKILYFSGANNPLYIFRQEEGKTKNFILKGTKQAIGLNSTPGNHYAVQIFDVAEGDMIYLFSDGFADQFGGDNDKKFTYRRFRDALAQASRMPVADQKPFLDNVFQAWKNGSEQTDDVCVMGIRI